MELFEEQIKDEDEESRANSSPTAYSYVKLGQSMVGHLAFSSSLLFFFDDTVGECLWASFSFLISFAQYFLFKVFYQSFLHQDYFFHVI